MVDWVAIGAVGELLGAIAVVVSIVYLATQVRQNAREIDHQTSALLGGSLSASESLASNFRNTLARDPQVASLWRRASDDYSSLSPDEQTQAHWLFSDLFWIFQGLHLRLGQGTVDETSWALVELNVREYMNMPGMRQWWPRGKANYTPEFCAAVELVAPDLLPGDDAAGPAS